MPPTYAEVAKYGRSDQGEVPSRATDRPLDNETHTKIERKVIPLVLRSKQETSLRSQKFALLDLPYHVRLMILDLTITPAVIPNFRHKKRVKPWISTPKMARVGNKRLRLETLMLYIEKSVIELHEEPLYPSTRAWLSSIDFSGLHGDTSYWNGLDAVKTLRFPMLRRFTSRLEHSKVPRSDLNLMMECYTLRTIVLEVDRVALVLDNNDDTAYCYKTKSISRLVRGRVIPQILSCKGLKVLNLRIMSWPDEDNYYDNFLQAVAECKVKLLAWFEEEFQKRNASVKVAWI